MGQCNGCRPVGQPQAVGLLNNGVPLNVTDSNRLLTLWFVDTQAKLRGPNSIIGRSVVVYGDGSPGGESTPVMHCAIGWSVQPPAPATGAYRVRTHTHTHPHSLAQCARKHTHPRALAQARAHSHAHMHTHTKHTHKAHTSTTKITRAHPKPTAPPPLPPTPHWGPQRMLRHFLCAVG